MSNLVSGWLSSLSQSGVEQVLRRFYIPVVQVLALVALLCIAIAEPYISNAHWWAVAVYYLGTGAVLSWALQMFAMGRGRLGVIVSTVAQALWLGNAIYLYCTIDDLSLSIMLGNASVLSFIVVAALIAPTLGTRSELPTWNYTLRTLGNILLAGLLSSLVAGGLSLLLWMMDELLGFLIPDKAFLYLWVSVPILLFTYLFLSQQPSRDELVREEAYSLKILTVFARYLLAPLLGLYLLVLYVYALRILLMWELPEGLVSVPISVSFGAMLLLVSLLYPVRQTGEPKRYDEFLCRWLPLLILPLLVLMSIGLGKRWSDYGVTIMRLYLLVANLWCYFACAYLFLYRSQRIRLLPLSLSLIFLLTSIGPWSFASLTRSYMRGSLERIIAGAEHKPQLPMSEEELTTFLESLPQEERTLFVRHLKYLDDTYYSESVEDIVEESVWIYGLEEDGAEADALDAVEAIEGPEDWDVTPPEDFLPFPDKFNAFRLDEVYFDVYEEGMLGGQFLDECEDLNLSVRIPIAELQQWAEAEVYRPVIFETTNPGVFFYATSMSVNVYKNDEGKIYNIDGTLKGMYVRP